ncbi:MULTISPECIES: type II toxin-antitoxin system YafQ family toxin [unclassified Candidatus Tisiphia]|uniref:type II toxin-antitoxin system RelE/ParE family toxin n=1 Tax=unclassified Candidatus Tisiphia TaxID=2996318 RepID=UPI00312C6DDE|nr:type II toxin-antitoxin system YafQ family toxin [Rickettsiaceae bacterium]MDD9336834.1 type II toxin-antitoxin system YafQ family toxin [Rickettsiaceae bacterium]
MKQIIQVTVFKRDLKRIVKRNKDLKKLYKVVEILVQGIPLPSKYRSHKLIGNYGSKYECHIEPDWLLIYEITDDLVILHRSGTHVDLFE